MCDRFISKKKEEQGRGQSMKREMVFIVTLHIGNATGSILTAIIYFK